MEEENSSDDSRKDIQRAIERNEDDFEKKLTYISAGALAISIAFLEKIVKLDDAHYFFIIIFGWSFLGLSLLINLASLLIGANNSSKAQDELDTFNNKEVGDNEFMNEQHRVINKIKNRNNNMSKINWASYIFLLLGIIFVILFASLNLYTKKETKIINNMSIEKTIKNNNGTGYIEKGKITPVPKPQTSQSISNSQQSNTNSNKK